MSYVNEGSSNPKSVYYSRKAHWPGSASGVTIGRGYDMKLKSKAQIQKDLVYAGVDSKLADTLSEGAKLVGTNASEFVKKPDINVIEITEEQEIILFNIAYQEMENTFVRICQKDDVEKKYGDCNLQKIDPAIKEFAVDLLYRGDYNPTSRQKIQKAIISNDYDTLIKQAQDRSNWGNVDGNRFSKRIEHLVRSKLIFNLNSEKATVHK